jgi:hypothetical protein
MASGTADLQRDLGGAILQSVFGALLSAGYATAFAATVAATPDRPAISANMQNQLTKSFAGAVDAAQQYPQYSSQIVAAAKSSFLEGADWAYAAGISAILAGALIVFFLFPKRKDEERLLTAYHAEDTATGRR